MRTRLAALLLVAAAARGLFFTGLQVGDDIVYSKIALARAEGEWRFSNVHEARLGFLTPLTIAYKLFGPGEVPLVLYNLLCSLSMVAVVFLLGRRFGGDAAGTIAGAVAALHPNLVFFASECHTDTPVAFWQALSVWVFVTAWDVERPAKRLALAGALIGWAWLHKEHAIFLLPLFAGHWIATRRRWTAYLPMAGAAFAVFAAESLFFAAATGDPLLRFTLVKALHVGHYMVEGYSDARALAHRLFLELPGRLFWPRASLGWEWAVNFLGLAAGACALKRKLPGAGLLAGWWLSIYLAYCFWPSSLSPYLPAFNLYSWTLPPLIAPLALSIAAELNLRVRALSTAVVALIALGSVASSFRLREEGRRFSAGPKEAHAWLAKRGERVITDDKTIEVLDFLDGHRPRRSYVPFQRATDVAGALVVVDKFWTEPGRWWSRPGIEIPPGWPKAYESERLIIYRP